MKHILLLITTVLFYQGIHGQVPSVKFKNSLSIFDENSYQIDSITTINGNIESVLRTNEIIQYNYKFSTYRILQDKLKALRDDLFKNSKLTDTSKWYSKSIVDSKFEKIESIKSELKILEKELNSLYLIWSGDYLQNKKFSFLSFGPKRSEAIFNMVYNHDNKHFKLLNNTGFSFGENTASIYSELVSGNLGVFRVSLGTMVTSNSDEESETSKIEEAYQRMVSYGGNTVLTLEYPLAYAHSLNNQYNLLALFIAKGTADFPEFGTSTNEFAGSGLIGLDIYADASLSNNKLRFFVNLNINGILGTDIYKENLGIENQSFSFGQLSLGLVIIENIKLSFMMSTISSEKSLRNKDVMIGGQILH